MKKVLLCAVALSLLTVGAIKMQSTTSEAAATPPAVVETVQSSNAQPVPVSAIRSTSTGSPESEYGSAAEVSTTDASPGEDPCPEDFENEKIEAALFASGYFRSDIPLDGDTQAELHAACDEFGVDFNLALAVIYHETCFQNINGDGGNSIGYMQIQPRWNQDRMERLGVTDLSVPYQNFRVGCSLLADLIDKYGNVQDALTSYNTGHPGSSTYASNVMATWDEFRGGAT